MPAKRYTTRKTTPVTHGFEVSATDTADDLGRWFVEHRVFARISPAHGRSANPKARFVIEVLQDGGRDLIQIADGVLFMIDPDRYMLMFSPSHPLISAADVKRTFVEVVEPRHDIAALAEQAAKLAAAIDGPYFRDTEAELKAFLKAVSELES